MKFVRMLAFILVGLAGVIASISIIFTTVAHLMMFAVAGNWIMVVILGLLLIFEITLLNYILGDYHGE